MNEQGVRDVVAEKLADGSVSISGPRGAKIVINGKMNDVVRLQFGGHLLGKMMAVALDTLEDVASREPGLALLIDAELQSGYEPEVRSLTTAWLLRHREKLRPAHLFSRAPMVKMWTQMINLALGVEIFKLHDDRGEFERTVGKVVRDSERMRAARRV
jgi:hypothetical protein